MVGDGGLDDPLSPGVRPGHVRRGETPSVVPAQEQRVALHHVPAIRSRRPGTGGGFLISVFGAPPGFSQSYADFHPDGTFTVAPKGVKINESCADSAKGEQAFSELVVSDLSAAAGSKVKGIDIDYTANGELSTLHVDWTLDFCGTDARLLADCKR